MMRSDGSEVADRNMKSVKELPTAVPVQIDGPPCHKCTALCCRYYALEIDTPEDREDFEALKWYLIHKNSWIWVDDDEWFLQVEQVCRYLGPKNECTIYDRRPQICREYGDPEHLEDPDEPLCDYFVQDIAHDLEFRELDEIEAYAEKVLAERENKKGRRGRRKRERRRQLARERMN